MWLAGNFSLEHSCLIQQTGDEKPQTYQVAVVILIEHQILATYLQRNVSEPEQRINNTTLGVATSRRQISWLYTKYSQEVELVTTEQGGRLEPGTTRLQDQHPNHTATLPFHNCCEKWGVLPVQYVWTWHPVLLQQLRQHQLNQIQWMVHFPPAPERPSWLDRYTWTWAAIQWKISHIPYSLWW